MAIRYCCEFATCGSNRAPSICDASLVCRLVQRGSPNGGNRADLPGSKKPGNFTRKNLPDTKYNGPVRLLWSLLL